MYGIILLEDVIMRYLPKGYSLELNNANYSICDVIGEGANSVVYLAIKDSDNSKHIIKEYNPCNVLIERKENGEFIFSDRDYEKFSTGMDVFCNGANKQINIRNYSEKIMNYITNVNQIVRNINNTAYIDMTIFNGESYDKLNQEETISDLLKRIKAIASAVSAFHEAGYLYLDLKPSNIFILENVFDLVLLFDFDSITKKENVKNMPIMSCSANWAAPEQLDPGKWGIISEKSDIFSIGEILFFKLFGRHSIITERRIFSEYDFGNVGLLNDVNPRIKPVLCQLLRKTLSTNPLRRYENCKGLLCDLEIAIKYADISRPYLVSSKESLPKYNVERETELGVVSESLKTNKVIAIRGMGGIGKSIFSKQYVHKCCNENGVGVFVSGASDWLDVVNNYIARHIHGADELGLLDEKVDPLVRFDTIVNKLGNICEGNDVFVLDNINPSWFEPDKKKYWEKLFSIDASFLLTTREKLYLFDEIYLDNMSLRELVNLFISWSGLAADQGEYIERIIKYVGYHTLTVELIAKQICQEGLTAQEKYEYLINKGLPNIGGRVVLNKDDQVTKELIIKHLADIFDFNDMSDKEILILSSGAVLPVDGISRRLFNCFCDDAEGEIVERIVDKGWLKCEEGIVSVHPLVAEVVRFNVFKSKDYVLDNILENAVECIRQNYKPEYIRNWELRKLQKQIVSYLIDSSYPFDEMIGFAAAGDFHVMLQSDLRDVLIDRVFLKDRYYDLDIDTKAFCDQVVASVYVGESNFAQAETYIKHALTYMDQITDGASYLNLISVKYFCALNRVKPSEACSELCEDIVCWREKFYNPSAVISDEERTVLCIIYGYAYVFRQICNTKMIIDCLEELLTEDIKENIITHMEPVANMLSKVIANSGTYDTEYGEKMLKQNIEVSKSNEYLYIDNYILLAEFYLEKQELNSLYETMKRIDEIVKYKYTGTESLQIAKTYWLWGEYYYSNEHTDEAELYFDQAEEMAMNLPKSAIISQMVLDCCLSDIDKCYKSRRLKRAMLKCHLLCKYIRREAVYQEYLSVLYMNLGLMYKEDGDFDESKECYLEALRYFKGSEDYGLMSLRQTKLVNLKWEISEDIISTLIEELHR